MKIAELLELLQSQAKITPYANVEINFKGLPFDSPEPVDVDFDGTSIIIEAE